MKTIVDGKGRTAAEFLAVEAAGAVMDRENIVAVMVIVAHAPKTGEQHAPVALRGWGGTSEGQADVLRKIADEMDREGVVAPPGTPGAPSRREAQLMATRHLEVMVGCYETADLHAIRTFLRERGFKVSESVHGAVLRVWAEKGPIMHPARPAEAAPAPLGFSSDEVRLSRQMGES